MSEVICGLEGPQSWQWLPESNRTGWWWWGSFVSNVALSLGFPMTTAWDQGYVWELGRDKNTFLHAITVFQMTCWRSCQCTMEGDSFNSQLLSPRRKQKNKQKLEAKCLTAPFLLGSFRSTVGTLASYKEPRVYSQKHEHMTMFEVGEQRTYTELASAGSRLFVEHMPWSILCPIVQKLTTACNWLRETSHCLLDFIGI